MTEEIQPLLSWLQRERRTNVVQEILWIHHYDLDGALAARQPELAWRARAALLVFGIELYLRAGGVYPPTTAEYVDTARIVLRHLARIDQQLGSDAWDLLLREAPTAADELEREVAVVVDFLEDRLGVHAAVSRGEAIRLWADGLKLLREIGKGLGVGASTDWYLSENAGHGTQLDWYDEVIRIAVPPARQKRPTAT